MTEIWEVVRLPRDVQRTEFERYYALRESDRRKLFERVAVLLRPKQKNYGLIGGFV